MTTASILLYLTMGTRSLRQRKMCSVIVVVTDVLVHQAFQVTFIENDQMVEHISAAIADTAFRNTFLPRTLEAGPLWLDSKALHGVDHFLIEVCAAIEDQVIGGRVVRVCLAQLLDDSGAARIFSHIAVKDSPPIMRDHKGAVENAISECRHGECLSGPWAVVEIVTVKAPMNNKDQQGLERTLQIVQSKALISYKFQ